MIESELIAVRKLDQAEHADVITFFEDRVDGNFLHPAKEQLRLLEAELVASEKMIKSTLSQFGYKISSEDDLSKNFFSTIVEIISLIKKSSDDVEKWLQQERIANEKAMKLESKSNNSTSEGVLDKKSQQNIFGNFRDQQKASSDDIILQLKKKMERRRQKAEAPNN